MRTLSPAPAAFPADLRRKDVRHSQQGGVSQTRQDAARNLCPALLRPLSTGRAGGSHRHAEVRRIRRHKADYDAISREYFPKSYFYPATCALPKATPCFRRRNWPGSSASNMRDSASCYVMAPIRCGKRFRHVSMSYARCFRPPSVTGAEKILIVCNPFPDASSSVCSTLGPARRPGAA